MYCNSILVDTTVELHRCGASLDFVLKYHLSYCAMSSILSDEQILSQVFAIPHRESAQLPVTVPNLSADQRQQLDAVIGSAAAVVQSQDHTAVQNAIIDLHQIIVQYDQQAALFDARAQCYTSLKQYDAAIEDLSTAIQLSRQYGQMNILRHSLLMRAMCTMSSTNDSENRTALNDLHAAAELGCSTSQQILARRNPYAKMCAAMVQQLMQQTSK